MLRRKYLILITLLVISIALYTLLWIPIFKNSEFGWLLTKKTLITITTNKIKSLLVILVAVTLITVTSLTFQTITESRILTPNVLGFDAIYVGSQVFIALIFGTNSILFANSYINFLINTLLMVLIALGVFKLAFKKNGTNMYIILMIGMIISTLMTNLSTFFKAIMNPQNYDSVLAKTTASIDNVNWGLFLLALPLMLLVIFYAVLQHRKYDTIALGKYTAINLGVDFNKELNRSLIVVSIGTAVATALIGPFTFLGLLAVNLAREVFKTYKHIHLIFGSALVGIIFVVLGQVLVAEFKIIPTLSTIVSLVGGLYVIRIILKENKL